MAESAVPMPLYVDLDGTLIKTDTLFEGLFVLLRRNPFWLLLLPLWLLAGRARLKAEVASRVDVRTEWLPVNPEFVAYLRHEKARGRRLILISASDQRAVSVVASYFTLFDQHIGSDGSTNLKAGAKLKRLLEINGNRDFAYAGNSSADIPLWLAAKEVIRVNCSSTLGVPAAAGKRHLSFDPAPPQWSALWQAMRPHQWLKNGLLFIPLVLAHQVNDLHLLQHAIVAFACFSLLASSVYLLNDLLDLEADRRHPTKRQRPLAAGDLPLQTAALMVPVLLLLAVLLAHSLPWEFVLLLGVYWLLTLLYSLMLKRLFLLDIVTLASLYTLRLLAGASAVAVPTSLWLLGFSLSLFLGLALVKRITELIKTADTVAAAQPDPGEGWRHRGELVRLAATVTDKTLPGRAYAGRHLPFLLGLGLASSLLAVVVFACYINAGEATTLYSSPMTLWPICGLLFLVLVRIWHFAVAGKLQEDPVLFALGDHPSQIATALMFVVLWMAV